MNRKQKRRLRKHANHERYLINRRRWCPLGPPVVLDEPTEEHVKGLLMLWLGPRAVLDEVANEISKVQADSIESQLYDFMAKHAGPIEIEASLKDELWRHLLHGALTNPAIPLKMRLPDVKD